ncbi:uncharacterized protein EI90DRAFT_1726423 [Cantharellus anzutake]|uniref:uncharacterized protein n=1 Tax=Cantharellus anzutake TaxID=1750568 RepID=UPI0019078A2B|nr:uncharacterized protein EI90DRAFT_1726423 [Cantharellus anzutake]KAF8341363.1 hypothetical protein EI90DRAFT_1726423 [Cantharellus anzutake]
MPSQTPPSEFPFVRLIPSIPPPLLPFECSSFPFYPQVIPNCLPSSRSLRPPGYHSLHNSAATGRHWDLYFTHSPAFLSLYVTSCIASIALSRPQPSLSNLKDATFTFRLTFSIFIQPNHFHLLIHWDPFLTGDPDYPNSPLYLLSATVWTRTNYYNGLWGCDESFYKLVSWCAL